MALSLGERLVASLWLIFGYHWYPCGHYVKFGELSETQVRRMKRRGWDGRSCPLCFGPKTPICHWCREDLEVGAQVTARVIPVEIPETECSPWVVDGEIPVAWLGNNVLVIFDQGNRRVGCSRPECLALHGERDVIGVLGPGGKITPLS